MSWTKDDHPKRSTTPYWLSLKKTENGIDGVWRDAYAKWDRCVGYTQFYNAPRDQNEDDADSMHICSTAAMVADLMDITEAAENHFGGEWKAERAELELVLYARGWVRK